MLSNYEYCEGSQYPLEMIHSDISNANFNVNPKTVGVVIKDIWKEKVKRITSNSSGPSRYMHLRKREIINSDTVVITKFDEDIIQRIEALVSTRNEDWVVDRKCLEEDVLLLRRCLKNNNISVKGQRLTSEIAITLSPQSITLSTCGKVVPLKVVEHTDEITVSLFTIENALRLVECSKTCLGKAISNGDFDSMVVPVSGSKVVTTSSSSGNEDRLVSLLCSLITCQNQTSCLNCQYVYTLFCRRNNKRKCKSNAQIPHNKCNTRYLEREGLQMKITRERKRRKNDVRRETRRKDDELIRFNEDDNADLVKIFQSVADKNAVPPDMELLWKQQVEQLAAKSSNGHRWNPRFYSFMNLKL